jgi:hypothetical protein
VGDHTIKYEACLEYRSHRFEEFSACSHCGWLEDDHHAAGILASITPSATGRALLERQAS